MSKAYADLLDKHNAVIESAQVGAGWCSHLSEMLDEMREVDPHIRVQLKSKFAELRASIRASKPQVQNHLYFIFQQTKQVLEHVCEECGQPGEKGMYDGAVMVYCPVHALET